MTQRSPGLFDRRTLITRSAATAAATAAVALLSRGALTASAQSSPESQDDLAALVSGNNAFALDLYHQLREGAEGNMLFSPYSVSLALAMTYAGARGDTASQMADALSFALPDPALHDAFGALTADLVERGNARRSEDEGGGENGLRIANALWGEATFPFDPAFTAQLEAAYGAGLQETDFINAPDAARDDINAWVEEQTEERIQDIVPEGAISSLTRLVLANAIYFYGSWLDPFDPENTEDDTFHLPDGATVEVPFMYRRRNFGYARREGMQLVTIPYAADGFAMTIILPDEGELDAFEDALDADALTSALAAIESTEILLWLPKFGFEFSAGLADALRLLGMADAFDDGVADFTGMIEGDPAEPLAISDVLHKAFIAVDEAGTEAAAATVVIMATSAAPEEIVEPPEVRVDRPFLFAIRDTRTGTMLFLGRVTDPSS